MIKALIFLLFSTPAHAALDLDTKFLGRILGASDSKRTILVNRGEEHGLVKNQHAKISIPSGLIARAVIVRLAPSRSVWSVYRVYNKERIKNELVATFKISSPVELTKDESKALGSLAPRVDKKKETVPKDPEREKKQRQIGRSIISKQKQMGMRGNVDFSQLSEPVAPRQKLDPELDWGALNGKRDGDSFDATLDYSLLK